MATMFTETHYQNPEQFQMFYTETGAHFPVSFQDTDIEYAMRAIVRNWYRSLVQQSMPRFKDKSSYYRFSADMHTIRFVRVHRDFIHGSIYEDLSPADAAAVYNKFILKSEPKKKRSKTDVAKNLEIQISSDILEIWNTIPSRRGGSFIGIVSFDADTNEMLDVSYYVDHDLRIVQESNGSFTAIFDTKQLWYFDTYASVLSPTIHEGVQSLFLRTDIDKHVDKSRVKHMIFTNVIARWASIKTAYTDKWDRYVVAYTDGKLPYAMLSTNGVYNDYTAAIEAADSSYDEKDFVQDWVNTITKTTRSEIEKSKKSLEKLQKQILTVSVELGQQQKTLDMINAGAESTLPIALQKIQTVPNVESVEFNKGLIIVTTQFLYNETQRYGRRFLGKYKIVLSIERDFIAFQNMYNKVAHPHAGSNSYDMCNGDYPDMLAQSLRKYDLHMVFSVMLAMLQDSNDQDMTASEYLSQMHENPLDQKIRNGSSLLVKRNLLKTVCCIWASRN
jgi:hypothetical protein